MSDFKKINRKSPGIETMVFGKVPPQDRDMEKMVLGAIIMQSSLLDEVRELLDPDKFYVSGHQIIFQCMCEMQQKNQQIDLLTLNDYLRKKEMLEMVGGVFYVTQLTNYFTGGGSLKTYCKLLYEKWILREIIRINGELISAAYEDKSDAFDLVNEMEKGLQSITLNTGTHIQTIDKLLVERFTRLSELRKQAQHVTGVPSGFHPVDKITHGWQPTDLIILAARPGVGKTAFALNLARNAASIQIGDKKPVPVGFFSLEMSAGQLVDRMMAAESEVWLDKIQTGQIEEEQMKRLYGRGVQPLAQRGIYIDDTPALNVFQLRSKARYMQRNWGVKLIIIDYLQLMSGIEDRKINNREQEISNISRNLKILAKELQVPIIALSQLSRDVEKRRGEKKSPQLSDLRDSGAIEQDADMVMFLYRPEYYEISANDMGESQQGLTELTIAKHRHGNLALGSDAIKLKALLHIQKFIEWTDEINALATDGAWRPVRADEKSDELPFG